MAHVSVADIQQWLETTKATVASVDAQLETSYFAQITTMLSGRYDTAGWISEASTPELIQSILSMYIAGTIYNRQYSENQPESGSSWGDKLMARADMLVQGLASGLIELGTDLTPVSVFGGPGFWPTDQATTIADPTQGGSVTDPAGAPLIFTMGKTF